MPLGLLAKDSIQDLTALGKDGTEDQSEEDGTLTTTTAESTASTGLCLESETCHDVEVAPTAALVEATEAFSGEPLPGAKKEPQQQTQQQPDPSATNDMPQEVEEQNQNGIGENSQNNGQYSEFSSSYHDAYYYSGYNDYVMSYYAPSLVLTTDRNKGANDFWKCLLPCLFPWTQSSPPLLPGTPATPVEEEKQQGVSASKTIQEDENNNNEDSNNISVVVEGGNKLLRRSSSSGDIDDVSSTGSDALGEKLSNRERHAVLAKLGFPPPEAVGDDSNDNKTNASSSDKAAAASSSSLTDGKRKKSSKHGGLLNDLQTYESSSQTLLVGGRRGILKRGGSITLPSPPPPSTQPERRRENDGHDVTQQHRKPAPNRRSLFPQSKYETRSTMDGSNGKSVSFASMARVVTVKSKNDMDALEKGAIWWRKVDYDDFKKTGRIITRAMLEGGSELWLNSERCTGSQARNFHRARSEGGGSGDTVDGDAHDPITVTGDKWWHRFGHSRRGLEHVVSLDEGKQRQLNVRSATRALVDEHRRQKLYHRVDAEKLRMVSLQYTSWARDLALASGSSDADAVLSSFSHDRKTREFYLSRMSDGNHHTVASVGGLMPDFMRHSIRGGAVNELSSGPTIAQRLDANTSAQLRYRRKNRVSQPHQAQRQEQQQAAPTNRPALVATVDASSSSAEEVPKSSQTTGNETTLSGTIASLEESLQDSFRSTSEGSEPIVDRSGSDSSMARRAAGFSADGAQNVDMAAVLSGMGAVPRTSQVLSSPA